jgi:outer membrane receptor for ferric coprogen and ferric-rhodotorulic acid
VAGQPEPGLQLSGGYAFVDVEDAAGNETRTFIPRHTLRLSAVYSPPSFDALRFGASARFQSRIRNDYIAQEGYAIVDLMARYEVTRNVSLAVNVDNVTNVKYWSSLQWGQAYYGAPRTVRATLGFSF